MKEKLQKTGLTSRKPNVCDLANTNSFKIFSIATCKISIHTQTTGGIGLALS